MTGDTRWPAIPLLILRGVQFLLGLILLGLSGRIISVVAPYQTWSINLTLVSALFTMLYSVINIVLFTMNLLLPLAIVIVDAFLLLLWLIALSGLGSRLSASGLFDISCSAYGYFDTGYYDTGYFDTEVQTFCGVIKANFSFSVLNFLLFIGTLVIASITLHKNRKDLRGAKYNSGLTPDGEAIDMEHHGNPGIAPAQGQGYYQETKPVDYQQNQPQFQQQQAGGYYPQQAQSIVSPPQTPAPYVQQQGYANATSPPPPPPPVNAQEMPSYR